MSRRFTLRTALLLAALATAAQLGAQSAPRLPAAVEHPILKPAGKLTLPQSREPFQHSLQISSDGTHWAQTATITYTNPCTHGGPASCGVIPPRFTLYLAWNPSIPGAQLSALSANAYYAILAPGNYMCFDVAEDRSVAGGVTTSQTSFNGPQPNSAQSFTCTYQVWTKVNQNGGIQTITTNPVTVNVNIVPATQ